MSRKASYNFKELAAEMVGQVAGIGAQALGIGGVFNEQYAEFFGESAGRALGKEFGTFVRESKRDSYESLASKLLEMQSPVNNPLFSQLLVPELARQMDL